MVNNADWLLKAQLHRAAAGGGCLLQRQQYAPGRVLQAAYGKGPELPGVQLHDHAESYDFYYLFQHYGCNMQFGGDDQWSNMLGGTELIRRKLGKDAHAMTITLLMNSEGKKMGKTASGAVWLDPNKTSPLRLLPVLAQRRRRGRFEVHPHADLPAARADRRDGQVGGQPAQPRQGRSWPTSSPRSSTAREEAKKAENAAKALRRRRRQRQYADHRARGRRLLKTAASTSSRCLSPRGCARAAARPAASSSRAASLWTRRRSRASTRASRRRSSPATASSSARARRSSTRP